MRQAIKVVLPWAAPEFGSRHALLDVGQSSGGVISRPWRFESQALRRTPSPNGNLRLASAFSPRRPPRPRRRSRPLRRHIVTPSELRRCSPRSVNRCPPSTTAAGRQPSAGAVADAAVAERIEAIWERSRRSSYGAPRIHTMLAREGILVGRKRVARLMRQLALPALTCTNTGKPPGKTGAPRGSRSGRAEFHRRCAEHAVGRRPDLYQNAARNPLPGGGAGCVLPQRWWVGRWPTP
jgi:hypothetical protein